MQRNRRAVIAAAVIALTLSDPRAVMAWQTSVNGRPGSDRDAGRAVAIDPATGSVFVGGARAASPQFDTSGLVVKYSASGEKQWQHVLNSSGLGTVQEIRLDVNGFVFVVGTVGSDVVVLKLDGRSGRKRVIWSRVVDLEASSVEVTAAVLTPDGGVGVAGVIGGTDGGITGFVTKLTGAGDGAWPAPQIIAGTARSLQFVSALAVLPDGDLAVAASLANVATNYDFTVLRLSGATGERQWTRSINVPGRNGDDFARALAVTPEGDIIAAGSVRRSDSDFAVVRLAPSGAVIWQSILDNGFADAAHTVAVGPNGDIVAGGVLDVSSGSFDAMFYVVSLQASDGAVRWAYEEAGTHPFLAARDIAFDRDGNPVVTGLGATADALTAFALLALDRNAGTILWSTPILGTAPLFNEGFAIVTDPFRNVVVGAGVTQNERSSLDLTLAHITDGREDWRRTVTGRGKRTDRLDDIASLALHARTGNVVLAGAAQNTGVGLLGTPTDFRLVKLRADGSVAWKYDLHDPSPHTQNAAKAATVTASGDVFAAGTTCNTTLTSCFTVVRVSRNGKEVWRRIVNGAVPGRDAALRIGIDPADGNVIAVGTLRSISSSQVAIVKLEASTGDIVWSSAGRSDLAGDARAMVLTNRGTVVVGASIAGNPGIGEFDLSTGRLVAQRIVTGLFGSVSAAAFDARDGSLVVAARVGPGDVSQTVVAKLDARDDLVWSRSLEAPIFSPFRGSIAIDPGTGAIALGTELPRADGRSAFAVVLFEPDGTERWRRLSDLPGSVSGAAFASGNVVTVGWLDEGPADVLAVLTFAPDGSEVWRRTFAGDADFGTNAAVDLVVDSTRARIVIGGIVTNLSTYQDMFAVGLGFDGTDPPAEEE